MAIITHGHFPDTFQEGFKVFLNKPENAQWRRKIESSSNRMVDSLRSLDPETSEILLKEMLKSSDK